MPAIRSNPALLLSAFLRIARRQAEPIPWVEALQQAALIGDSPAIGSIVKVMQGAFASQLGESGTSSMFIRELPPHQLAELCEAALQQLEAEAAAEEAGEDGAGSASKVRGFDFSDSPCNLG